MKLDDLREALGRDLTRDDIRQIEILAEFHGFDVREFLEGDRYAFIKRTGRKPGPRVRRKRTRYGIRHRLDCMTVSLAPRSDNGFDRCLGCVLAARRAHASTRVRPRCEVCSHYFAATANRSRTCSKICRYRLSSSTRRAAGRTTDTCKLGHVKSKLRSDGYRECAICKAERQRVRRSARRVSPAV